MSGICVRLRMCMLSLHLLPKYPDLQKSTIWRVVWDWSITQQPSPPLFISFLIWTQAGWRLAISFCRPWTPSVPLQTSQWKSTKSSGSWALPAPTGLFDPSFSSEGVGGEPQNCKCRVFSGFYRKKKLPWSWDKPAQAVWADAFLCFFFLFIF